MANIYLRPGHANPNDVTLRDPTTADTAGSVTITPAIAILVVSGIAPQLRTSLSPAVATLVLAGRTSTVTVSDHKTVSPAAATLTLAGQTSTVRLGTRLTPAIATLAFTGQTPTVTVAAGNITVSPAAAALTLTGIAPNVTATVTPPFEPAHGGVTWRGRARRFVVPQPVTLSPRAAHLTLWGIAPTLWLTENVIATPRRASLRLIGWAPEAQIDSRMRDLERELEEESLLLGV